VEKRDGGSDERTNITIRDLLAGKRGREARTREEALAFCLGALQGVAR